MLIIVKKILYYDEYGYQPMDDDRFANVMVIRSSIPKFCDDYVLIFNVDVIVREPSILCPVAAIF